MLRPITSRHRGKTPRLWFSDENHDLFIWLDPQSEPLAFQFSYDKLHDEHCIYWHRDRGYSHDRIDSGEPVDGSYKMTPIMVPNDQFDDTQVAQDFLSVSDNLTPKLRDFVFQKLKCYADF